MSSDEATFLEEMRALRARGSTTATNPRKRRLPLGSAAASDDENERPSTPLPSLLSTGNILVSRNVATAVKTYAKKQKLRGDQETQVETFLTVKPLPPSIKSAHKDRYRTPRQFATPRSSSAFLLSKMIFRKSSPQNLHMPCPEN